MTLVCCISDTHSFHDQVKIKPCDLLLVAGDITKVGDLEDAIDFAFWLRSVPAKQIVLVAGNHDFCYQNEHATEARNVFYGLHQKAVYLQDSSFVYEGLKIYGSPWSPWFYDWAFNARRGKEIQDIWAKIPEDSDIVITHGPIYGYGDNTLYGKRVGDEDLLLRLQKVRPELHVCGHIHEDYGVFGAPWMSNKGHLAYTVNASQCNIAYQVKNEPIYLDL